MSIENWVRMAYERGASDLHLEPGQPPVVRINGDLVRVGEAITGAFLLDLSKELVGGRDWPEFLARRSFDTSRVIAGVRCRINVMKSARGVGLAVRLLAGFRPTLERLNLNPELGAFANKTHGLVLVTGPTGSGKSSTMAALIGEVNTRHARHILTVEAPIEYALPSAKSLVRQREVGRDTPSFERALLDALREDPDVIVVGEMRSPEVMRLTLGAAETGHLVFATMHSASCVEALGRVIASFPPETQSAISAQLADCLVGVIAQQLIYDPLVGLRLPVCEVLVTNHAIRGMLRKGDLFRISSVIETGREDGMWTFERYRRWLSTKGNYVRMTRPQLKEQEGHTSAPVLPRVAAGGASSHSVPRRGHPSAGAPRPAPHVTPPAPWDSATPSVPEDVSEVEALISQLSLKSPKIKN